TLRRRAGQPQGWGPHQQPPVKPGVGDSPRERAPQPTSRAKNRHTGRAEPHITARSRARAEDTRAAGGRRASRRTGCGVRREQHTHPAYRERQDMEARPLPRGEAVSYSATDAALVQDVERLRAILARPFIGAWTDEVIVEAAHQR